MFFWSSEYSTTVATPRLGESGSHGDTLLHKNTVTRWQRNTTETNYRNITVRVLVPNNKRLSPIKQLNSNQNLILRCWQCCGSGKFIPDPNFSIPFSHFQMFILYTLSKRVRNWCVHWACVSVTDAYAEHTRQESDQKSHTWAPLTLRCGLDYRSAPDPFPIAKEEMRLKTVASR